MVDEANRSIVHSNEVTEADRIRGQEIQRIMDSLRTDDKRFEDVDDAVLLERATEIWDNNQDLQKEVAADKERRFAAIVELIRERFPELSEDELRQQAWEYIRLVREDLRGGRDESPELSAAEDLDSTPAPLPVAPEGDEPGTPENEEIRRAARVLHKLLGPVQTKFLRAAGVIVGGVIAGESGARAGAMAARGGKTLWNMATRIRGGKTPWEAVKGIGIDIRQNFRNSARNAVLAAADFFKEAPYERDASKVKKVINRAVIAGSAATGAALGASVATVVKLSTPALKPLETMFSVELATVLPRMFVGLSEVLRTRTLNQRFRHLENDQITENERILLGDPDTRWEFTRSAMTAMVAGATAGAVVVKVFGLDSEIAKMLRRTDEVPEQAIPEQPAPEPEVQEPAPESPVEVPEEEVVEATSGVQEVDTIIGPRGYQYDLTSDGALTIATNVESGPSGIFQAFERLVTGDENAIIGDMGSASDKVAAMMNRIDVLGATPSNMKALEEAISEFAGDRAVEWALANGTNNVAELAEKLAENPATITFLDKMGGAEAGYKALLQ